MVLLISRHAIADKTRRLYAALEPSDFSSGQVTELASARLERGVPLSEAELVNTFTRAARAVFPGLAEAWQEAERVCARKYFLSGAGPALFALAANRSDARQQLHKLRGMSADSYAVRTVKHSRASLRFAAGTRIRYP
jgi:4-diphosphocytidyl-2-C-methyl-D-erythritol kinase